MNRLACILVFAFAFAGCGALTQPLEQPTAELQDVALQSISLSGTATLRADFLVTNPNGFGIPVEAVDYQVSIGSSDPVSGRVEANTTIPANGTAPLNVQLDLNAFAAVDIVRRLAAGEREYRVDGVIHFASPIGKISMNFSESGTISE